MVSSLAVPHVAGPSYPQCNTCFVVRACARGESLMRERGCFGFHVTEMHTLQRGATTYLNRAHTWTRTGDSQFTAPQRQPRPSLAASAWTGSLCSSSSASAPCTPAPPRWAPWTARSSGVTSKSGQVRNRPSPRFLVRSCVPCVRCVGVSLQRLTCSGGTTRARRGRRRRGSRGRPSSGCRGDR
jgi:hypothetical protein